MINVVQIRGCPRNLFENLNDEVSRENIFFAGRAGFPVWRRHSQSVSQQSLEDLDWGFFRPAAVREFGLGIFRPAAVRGRPAAVRGAAVLGFGLGISRPAAVRGRTAAVPGIWIGDFPSRRRSGVGDRPGYAANLFRISVVRSKFV